MENQKIFLSVIIPAYNEEKRLPKTLNEIDNYLSGQDYSYEIIIVNDGSKDKTAQIVRELSQKIKNLKLIDNKENHGKGYVVRQGMLEAKGEYRLFTDADNSTSLNQIEKMWPEFEKGYDIVIGSRDIKGAILDPPQSFLRKIILGKGFRILTQIICGTWGIYDTQCGFKCFKDSCAKDIFPRCQINRFAFDPEILIIAKKLGYKIKEIPVYWKNNPESKVKIKSVFNMFFDLFRIRKNLILDKYNLKQKNKEQKKGYQAINWKKSDLFCILIIGELVGWLAFAVLKNLNADLAIYQLMLSTFGRTFDLKLFLAVSVPIIALICLYITYLLGKKKPVFFQIGKYAAVGILNTLLDLGILSLEIILSGITSGLYYSIFKSISFLVAVINSYFWNKFWTFNVNKTKKAAKEFLQFLIVSGIGFGINVGVASLIVNLIGPQAGINPQTWSILGATLAIIFSMIWNFFGYKFIVFKNE